MDERISTITIDNCTTNDDVIEALQEKPNLATLIWNGRFLCMRSHAHELNLIVRDSVGIIDHVIEKV